MNHRHAVRAAAIVALASVTAAAQGPAPSIRGEAGAAHGVVAAGPTFKEAIPGDGPLAATLPAAVDAAAIALTNYGTRSLAAPTAAANARLSPGNCTP